jgi:hypothetical protein
MSRDLTQRQFDKKCKEYGFEKQPFMGYYKLNIPGRNIQVSVLNVEPRRRDQLAYLIAQEKKIMEKEDIKER